MHKIFVLILLCCSCAGNKLVSFDPFNYDANAYEKVKLHYIVEGKGDTTLFFLHGWNLDLTYWQNQRAFFSQSYKLVLLDLAGHGQSGKNRKNWTIESFAKDIISVVDKEQLKNVILVAHSMAGEIAVEAATSSPGKIAGIIGVDNLKNVGMTISDDQRNGIQPYIKKFLADYQSMAEGMAKDNTRSKDTAVINRIVYSYKNADPRIAVPVLMNLFPKAADVKNKLPQLSFPIKFIMCSYSPYDEQAFKQYCKSGYEIVSIDSSGHFPMVEQPLAFNKALQKLLSGK